MKPNSIFSWYPILRVHYPLVGVSSDPIRHLAGAIDSKAVAGLYSIRL